MQDSFQNKMSAIIRGSWGRETQPSTAQQAMIIIK